MSRRLCARRPSRVCLFMGRTINQGTLCCTHIWEIYGGMEWGSQEAGGGNGGVQTVQTGSLSHCLVMDSACMTGKRATTGYHGLLWLRGGRISLSVDDDEKTFDDDHLVIDCAEIRHRADVTMMLRDEILPGPWHSVACRYR